MNTRAPWAAGIAIAGVALLGLTACSSTPDPVTPVTSLAPPSSSAPASTAAPTDTAVPSDTASASSTDTAAPTDTAVPSDTASASGSGITDPAITPTILEIDPLTGTQPPVTIKQGQALVFSTTTPDKWTFGKVTPEGIVTVTNGGQQFDLDGDGDTTGDTDGDGDVGAIMNPGVTGTTPGTATVTISNTDTGASLDFTVTVTQ